MYTGLRELVEARKLLDELPPGRKVFWRTAGISLEVDRQQAAELLDKRLAEEERRLRDALEKIKAAFRALAEQDERRFRALAAEIGVLVGVVPEDRFGLEALQNEIEKELAAAR
ncbi:hypothetical protein [Oceanithermus sp.]